MKVEVAKHSGFCFGVSKAVNTVYDNISCGKKVYTLGPIVHNDNVVSELKEKNINVIDKEEDLFSPEILEIIKDSRLIIRAHGISEKIYNFLDENKIDYIDATCPFVKRIHNIVEKESLENRYILVIGSADHPEVKGIIGWIKGDYKVIESVEDANSFDGDINKEYCIVAQTTFKLNKFKDIVEIFEKKGYNCNVMSTICNATMERQTATRELAKRADCMIVIGGEHSSNTRKLYEICKEECSKTFYIQTLADLHISMLENTSLVGITAGASTPQNIIEEVQNNVRIII